MREKADIELIRLSHFFADGTVARNAMRRRQQRRVIRSQYMLSANIERDMNRARRQNRGRTM